MVKLCESSCLDEKLTLDGEEEKEELLTINIKTLRGPDSSITVRPHTSVALIKEEISKKKSVPVDKQRLIFRGRCLVDNKTVTDIGVTNGDTIHLVVRPNIPHPLNGPPTRPANNSNEEIPQIQGQPPITNFLNQLFDVGSNNSDLNQIFLIDQLRQNLNRWQQEANSILRPNEEQPASPSNPSPWQMNVDHLRTAVQATQEAVDSDLSQIFDHTSNLISNQENSINQQTFTNGMRPVAVSFRRLGNVFGALGKLLSRVKVNSDTGNIEFGRGQQLPFQFQSRIGPNIRFASSTRTSRRNNPSNSSNSNNPNGRSNNNEQSSQTFRFPSSSQFSFSTNQQPISVSQAPGRSMRNNSSSQSQSQTQQSSEPSTNFAQVLQGLLRGSGGSQPSVFQSVQITGNFSGNERLQSLFYSRRSGPRNSNPSNNNNSNSNSNSSNNSNNNSNVNNNNSNNSSSNNNNSSSTPNNSGN